MVGYRRATRWQRVLPLSLLCMHDTQMQKQHAALGDPIIIRTQLRS
jgi:hypothetical protein